MSASDNVGVTRVELLVNQSPVGEVTQAPWAITWHTASLANGTYTLVARAHDAAGNSASSQAVSVTVANQSGGPDPEPPPNVAPSVSLTSPADGASAPAPATVTLAASASDPDGTIASVEFYADGALLGSDAAAPYAFTWSNVAAGTYALTARAIDNLGGATSSAPVTVSVTQAAPQHPPANAAPSVTVTSPADGASATAPASIAITASASDTDGTVVDVEFYAGSTLIGSDATAALRADMERRRGGHLYADRSRHRQQRRRDDLDGGHRDRQPGDGSAAAPAPPAAGAPGSVAVAGPRRGRRGG